MANPAYKCNACGGNLWPDTGHYKDHIHLENPKLKQKYIRGYTGRKGGAPTRTNAKTSSGSSLRPRRRAYGPF